MDHAWHTANITPQIFWDIAVGRFGNGQVAVLLMLVPFVAFLFHVTVFMGYVSRWGVGEPADMEAQGRWNSTRACITYSAWERSPCTFKEAVSWWECVPTRQLAIWGPVCTNLSAQSQGASFMF
jgi:hypothetical protein